MTTKNFIFDTNVLLHDPNAMFGFEDNNICIPIVVIEEIDTFKKDATELGRNAREVSRQLDRLRERGSLSDGVTLDQGGLLRVVLKNVDLPVHLRISHVADNLIMATALHIKESEPERPAIFVTMDTNLRIRADALGLRAVDYDVHNVGIDEVYTGATEISADPEYIDAIYGAGRCPVPVSYEGPPLVDNEYVTVSDGPQSVLARYIAAEGGLALTLPFRKPIWGVRPRNREQQFALDACMRPDIEVVSLVGKAGTGKTLLALAAGLQQVVDEGRYSRLLVSRPIMPLGKDIGFLPGELSDKLKPWMMPIHDNLEFLMGLTGGLTSAHAAQSAESLTEQGILAVEPLTYIRGRSIPNQYMIVDEAQNLTPHEIKTILTRAGAGTKIVLTGDPYQIDNPYVDSTSNGLVHLVERFKGQSIAASVTLKKGERSALAELAANLL